MPATVLGTIMSILDTTIVTVALATMSRQLHATLASIQWVVTGYMLALAAVIPVSGWAARRFGAKNVWLISVLMFTLGSMMCGLATSTTELIAFRVLQGVGGGMILPVGQMMMVSAAGPRNMGRIIAISGVPSMLAPVFGPMIGGAIIQLSAWRWIFFVNVPIGLLTIAMGMRMIRRSERTAAEPLDFIGLVLMALGLPLLTYGLAEFGTSGGFSSPRVILPCVAGLILIVAFIRHALAAKRPLLQLHLYRRATFSAASLVLFLLCSAMYGSMVLLPLYWQELRHYGVLDTGLLVAPQGLGMALVMPFAGRLSDRHGGGPLAMLGVVLTAALTVPFAFIGAHTSIYYLMTIMLFRGIGMSFGMVPPWAAAYASLKPSEISDAAPQLNVLMRVGGSAGTALLTVVLQRQITHAHTVSAVAGGYRVAFWWALGMITLAMAPALILLRSERRSRVARAAEKERTALDERPVAEALA